MKNYRYSLIRFVADALRMEPVNVGLILQDESRLDFQLNPHFARRGNVDTAVFRRWKEFLTEEIQGPPLPLFQPRKTSSEFFSHLAGLCDGTIRISEPLAYQVDDGSFDEVLNQLYSRLVAPTTNVTQADSSRPSGRFRQLTTQYNFLQRGMQKHSHLALPDNRRWMPYRHVLNGQTLAIDKVEVAREIGRTANEIQALAAPLQFLDAFLVTPISGRPTRYVLLADRLDAPFSEQSAGDFQLMCDDLEKVVESVQKAGGEVIRDANSVSEFAAELNEHLPLVPAPQTSA